MAPSTSASDQESPPVPVNTDGRTKEALMEQFRDYQRKASMYYVYHTIQRYMVCVPPHIAVHGTCTTLYSCTWHVYHTYHDNREL